MQDGAFNQTTLKGDEFKTWLVETEAKHKSLMEEAGFLAAPQ
jgi:putative tricarboxylic transport membrane protein